MTTELTVKEAQALNLSRGTKYPVNISVDTIMSDIVVQEGLHKMLLGHTNYLFSQMIKPVKDENGIITGYNMTARDDKHQLESHEDADIEAEYAWQMRKERLHPEATPEMLGEGRGMTHDELTLMRLQGADDLGIDASERFGTEG